MISFFVMNWSFELVFGYRIFLLFSMEKKCWILLFFWLYLAKRYLRHRIKRQVRMAWWFKCNWLFVMFRIAATGTRFFSCIRNMVVLLLYCWNCVYVCLSRSLSVCVCVCGEQSVGHTHLFVHAPIPTDLCAYTPIPTGLCRKRANKHKRELELRHKTHTIATEYVREIQQ